jgi:hypothetical protein
MDADKPAGGRILPDDELVALPRVRALMGGIAISTAYDDPELMALKINVTGVGNGGAVRWIEREVHGLRAKRVAMSEARSANARARVEARLTHRRAKQRASSAAAS